MAETSAEKSYLQKFNTLKEMFPEHDDNFIEEAINNFNREYKHNSETDSGTFLNYFLDLSLLKNNEFNSSFYPPENDNNLNNFFFKDFEQSTTSDQMTVKDKHEHLIKAFPNADPNFLLNIVEQYHEDPDKLYQVVENKLRDKLLNGNYKTRSEHYANLKSIEKQVENNEFKIEEFLIKYSNPFDFFENFKRECNYNVNGLNFLKQRYVCYKVCELFSFKFFILIFNFLILIITFTG